MLVSGVIVVILVGIGSPSSSGSAGQGTQGAATAVVQRHNLVQTDTESGTVGYADPQTVYNRLSGTITSLPSVGQTIRPGGVLYRIDGRPVVLLSGATPAYRDLTPGDSAGQDVLQLNRNLVALGFNPDGIVRDDSWQAATTAGVESLQRSLGEKATGSLALGQVVFLRGSRLISAIDQSLGSGGGGSGSPSSSSASASARVPAATAQFVDLATTTPTTPTIPATTTPTTTSPSAPISSPGQHHPGNSTSAGTSGKRRGSQGPPTLASLMALLRAQSALLRADAAALRADSAAGGTASHPHSSPKSSDSASAPKSSSSGGGGSPSGTPILETTSTRLLVTVDLDASKQSEAKVGERVTVVLPAGNTVNGRITSVSSVAQSSSGAGGGGGGGGGGAGSGTGSGGSGSPTVPVTIALDRHVGGVGLDQAAVSVNFSQAQARHVLSVPVTALLATSGGGYAVQEANAQRTLIPVSTGLFAAGEVQISGPGIYSGLTVTDSQG